jgi:purine nucleosidase
MDRKRVIVDTDTAGDDTQALLYACLTDRLDVEAVTIVAGNVPFDYEVENAKYTLRLAGAADTPVHEGARSPLLKKFEHAEYVHGEGGLGGELFPDTGIPSAEGFGPDVIAERAREAPGELSLLCIGPLTNVALALAREPELPELLEEVWVMGGAANHVGNVTPAAEYNFWVDPDAARRVMDAFETTLVDWGLCLRDSVMGPEVFERVAEMDTELAEFFQTISEPVREFTTETQGVDGPTQPDSLTAALMAHPELIEAEGRYHVAVDEREGLTRGYSAVDTDGVTDGEARTRVIESADGDAFRESILSMLAERDPDGPLA